MAFINFLRKVLSFLLNNPSILIGLLLVGAMTYGHFYLMEQKETINKLQNQVTDLDKQNKDLAKANEDLANDMKAVKQGMETYNTNIIAIRETTAQLQKKFKDKGFQQLLKTDIKKAETEFNGFFNEYLNQINEGTKTNAK